MGKGYTLRCKECGYEISANLGIDFFFPKAYQESMVAARAGKPGKTIQLFLQEHPDGALNIDNVFLQCTECGTLKSGPDLSILYPGSGYFAQGTWAVVCCRSV